jgi:hypothetical protein
MAPKDGTEGNSLPQPLLPERADPPTKRRTISLPVTSFSSTPNAGNLEALSLVGVVGGEGAKNCLFPSLTGICETTGSAVAVHTGKSGEAWFCTMGRPKTLIVSGLIVAMALCMARLSESARILPGRGEGGPPIAGYSYTTTGTGEIPPMSKDEVNWSKGSTYADISLIFDSQAKLQKILGFGGNLIAGHPRIILNPLPHPAVFACPPPWHLTLCPSPASPGAFTEASAYNYKKLSKPDRERVMQMYFGAEGNRYNMGRIPMGSCDFSTKVASPILPALSFPSNNMLRVIPWAIRTRFTERFPCPAAPRKSQKQT